MCHAKKLEVTGTPRNLSKIDRELDTGAIMMKRTEVSTWTRVHSTY